MEKGTTPVEPARIGEFIEQAACRWLSAQGLQLLAHNYRCRFGEIDLIMREDDTLVFVEVRFRRRAHFGSAAESVDSRKQGKLVLAAGHFLSQQAQLPLNCRFDVVAAQRLRNGELSFEWIKNAFDG